MSTHILKNIAFETVLQMESLVDYQEGQVVSRTLAQNSAVSVTLFAFDGGEEISSHKSDGDALVTILEGAAHITIGNNHYSVDAGKSIVMPAGVAHAVEADGRFKMLLVVVFPHE